MSYIDEYNKYCKPWLEVRLVKPKFSLIGEFFVIVDKGDVLNFQSAIKTSLATFLTYFDQKNASELYGIASNNSSMYSYTIVNSNNDIKYVSENLFYYIGDNSEQTMYQYVSSIEGILDSIIIENKDKFIFFIM